MREDDLRECGTDEAKSAASRYVVVRTGRRRTVAISVEPQGRVLVLAPHDAPSDRIHAIVNRRRDWIHRQQRRFATMPAPRPPRAWVNGETHRYLGRQYRLRIRKGASSEVRLRGAFFTAVVKDPGNRSEVARLMRHWYRERALTLLEGRVASALGATTWLADVKPTVALRAMRKRWGSATPRGILYFNVEIIQLPVGCIDYVIAHELAHLKVPNHGPAFWRMLTRVMPDWPKWRERLAGVEI